MCLGPWVWRRQAQRDRRTRLDYNREAIPDQMQNHELLVRTKINLFVVFVLLHVEPNFTVLLNHFGSVDVYTRKTFPNCKTEDVYATANNFPGHHVHFIGRRYINDIHPLMYIFWNSERTMDLKLVLNNTENGLMWLGVSGRQLGKLGPGGNMDIELTLLSTVPGLQVGFKRNSWLFG